QVGSISTPTGDDPQGLWGIAFGNGLDDQPTNTLFFAAGTNDEANGLYGRIDVEKRRHHHHHDWWRSAREPPPDVRRRPSSPHVCVSGSGARWAGTSPLSSCGSWRGTGTDRPIPA